MCAALKISESGYYRWLRNRGRAAKRQLLLVEIQKILEQHEDNDNYGVKRIHTALEQKEIRTSIRTVYRAMKEGRYLHKRRVSHGITKADTETQEKENRIKQDFHADEPLKKFLTDITEVPCANGKLYVSPVLDCFNGEIVALEMRNNMKKELCIDTVKQLKLKYGKQTGGAIIHSDRGSQYTSEGFREELAKAGLVQSLSGVNHCYDNARMESFFATLKKEKLYRIPTYRMTMEEVKTVIFRYIFGYYNTIRVNSFNPHGLPPAKLRAAYTDDLAA